MLASVGAAGLALAAVLALPPVDLTLELVVARARENARVVRLARLESERSEAVWLAARAGMKLVPMLLVGYGVWGIILALVVTLRRSLGV